MGLRCEPLTTVRVGVIGLGRGAGAVDALAQIPASEVIAICDLNPERIANGQKILKKHKRKEAITYTG